MITLSVFILSYLLFALFSTGRAWIALAGAFILLLFGAISPLQMLTFVNWNVIALFLGTLILAELFMLSGMPELLAELLVKRTSTAKGAVLAITFLSSLLSIFVENVAVVLLLAPICLKVCQRVQISPVKPLLFLAIFSNIQGTSTLIGDPPSMIFGSYMKMSFLDFFFYQGKISIFFFVQFGALAAFLVAAYLLRKEKNKNSPLPVDSLKSFIPSLLLIVFVFLLSIATLFDPEFTYFAGSAAMSMALVGLIWLRVGPKWCSPAKLIQLLDWDTTFFLVGIFILVGALISAGWLETLAAHLAELLSGHLLLTFITILLISVSVSAFVDNVPYLLAMIPVVSSLAIKIEASETLLLFTLLIGSCLGGNITPIGASANIVAVGILQKEGYPISFKEFTKIGLPITLAAVAASSAALWFLL